MTRKKVKLGWIENDKARAISLKRRREGLLKKVKELTILCDVRACIIIFSPNEAEPKVWPSVETARGLLDDFFALPKFVQTKKEMGIESFLEEKIKTVHEQLMKNHKKIKEYANDELMMQLQHGRDINDLNLREIYELLSFSKDKIMLCRKKLEFMQFPPLRDPPVPPFDVKVEQLTIPTNDAFVGDSQDDDYLIDQWVSALKPLEPVIYQQMENENPNPNSYRQYQGSSSNGNPNLEMEPVYPQVTFHGLVESASQPLQHLNPCSEMESAYPQVMTSNGLVESASQPLQHHNMNNNNSSQFCRGNNAITTNDDLRQEPPRNETTTGEDNG